MNHAGLLLYQNIEKTPAIDSMLILASGYPVTEEMNNRQELARICIREILDMSVKMGFRGNLWQNYAAYFLASSENAFSLSCERKGLTKGSINDAALLDFAMLRNLFTFDLEIFDGEHGTSLTLLKNFENNNEDERYFNKRIRDGIMELAQSLSTSATTQEFLEILCAYYKNTGVGTFGMFKAFRVERDDQGHGVTSPIVSIEHSYLQDLIGYEIQKQKLIKNTEAFLQGQKANNVLLFGDSGTGKSSSIKGLLNEYYDQGLRMIEVYKHQFKDLSAIINQIKDRNYKFIIYMDDLSFEEFEIEYKYLKALIEGGLEKRPDNVLIYATSNRRHLVREKFSDKEERDDDLHSRDTVQEKLSLSARFGLSIYYGSPDKKEFNAIVEGLAERSHIALSRETILAEANKWEMSHGGLSGRNAQQFINYLEYTIRNER